MNANQRVKMLTDNGIIGEMPHFAEHETWDFNCWGFTARLLDWIDRERWLKNGEMRDLLSSHSIHIEESEVQVGDIAVYGDVDVHLEHTALVSELSEDGNHIFVHKPGACALEVASISEVLDWHGVYGDITEWRRPC